MDKNLLISNILENTEKYYNGKDCVPDSVFDSWIENLREIDPDNKILHSVGWGYDVASSNLKKSPHLSDLTGISNKPRVKKEAILPSGVFKTPKMDGGSVELQYSKGILVRALTRGDGTTGLDCTSKLQFIVPSELKSKFTGSVVGEYVISDEDMLGFSDSISQRNIPNGFLSRDKASKEDCERFSFVAYKVGRTYTHSFTKRVQILEFLKSEGFLTVDYVMGSIVYEDAISRLRVISGKHYLLDGIVASSTEVITQESGVITYIGELAYKTINDTAQVRVDHIDWNLTRTGKLVPVAVLDPVVLSGANIDRVLAHNADNVLNCGIGPDSIIELVRSGEVIPYILEVISPVEVDLPKVCPSCGAPLKWSGVNLVCDNPECSGRQFSNLKRWIKVLASVDNLGGSLIESFIDFYEILSVDDLYEDIDLTKFIRCDGIGESKVEVISKMLSKLKSPHTLEEYLVAMNLDGVSWESASKIVKNSDIWNELQDSYFSQEFEDSLLEIKGLTKNAVLSLLKNWNIIRDRVKYMIISEETPEEPKNESRIKVCVTGSLNEFKSRKDFYEKYKSVIEESSVTDCDYLICNQDKGSSKITKAKKLGVRVITESEFYEVIKESM